MGDQVSVIKPRIIVEAVVTRADGTVENLGVIADSENNQVEAKILKKKRGKLNG